MDLQRSLCDEHASEAAFLWTQRDRAVSDPCYDRRDLAALDERLEAHLDGLRFAGKMGVECATATVVDEPAAGETFVAMLVAIDLRNLRAIANILDLVGDDVGSSRGIVSALGWAPQDLFEALLPGFLAKRCPPALHRMGIAACAIRRTLPPNSMLEHALASTNAPLRARALRAVGELKNQPLIHQVRASLEDTDESCRFWAAWSGSLLGDTRAVEMLWAFANRPGDFAERAATMAACRLDARVVVNDVPALAKVDEGFRPAFAAAAALGDPVLVPWLMDRMADPVMARRAGLALSMITGVDLGSAPLEGEAPEGFAPGPNDDTADEDVSLDPDDGLPFANLDAVRAWWEQERGRFEVGNRYFLGKPVTDGQWLEDVLERGHQVARASAAIQLTLAHRRKVLPEVRAVGWR